MHELWSEPDLQSEERNVYQNVFDLRERLQESADIAEKNAKLSAGVYKTYFDKRTSSRKFRPGNEVLLMLPTDSNKLLMQWKGPYSVMERKSQVDYVVCVKGRNKLFHANMMKIYHRRTPDTNSLLVREVLFHHSENRNDRLGIVQISVVEEEFEQDDFSGVTTVSNPSSELPKVSPHLDQGQRDDISVFISDFTDVLSICQD